MTSVLKINGCDSTHADGAGWERGGLYPFFFSAFCVCIGFNPLGQKKIHTPSTGDKFCRVQETDVTRLVRRKNRRDHTLRLTSVVRKRWGKQQQKFQGQMGHEHQYDSHVPLENWQTSTPRKPRSCLPPYFLVSWQQSTREDHETGKRHWTKCFQSMRRQRN